jgi:hypothetical protein
MAIVQVVFSGRPTPPHGAQACYRPMGIQTQHNSQATRPSPGAIVSAAPAAGSERFFDSRPGGKAKHEDTKITEHTLCALCASVF